MNTDAYEFSDSSVTITFPSKWTLVELDDGHIELSSGNFMIQAHDNVALENAFDFTSADTVEDALIEQVQRAQSQSLLLEAAGEES